MRRRGAEALLGSRSSAVAGWFALLAGIGWLVLVPAGELERRDLLSYEGYNRLVAPPLLLFGIALLLAPSVLSVRSRLGGIGMRVAAVGSALLLVGNLTEFYGVLLQDDLNAQGPMRPE